MNCPNRHDAYWRKSLGPHYENTGVQAAIDRNRHITIDATRKGGMLPDLTEGAFGRRIKLDAFDTARVRF